MSNISLGFLSFENQMPVLSNIEIIVSTQIRAIF